MKDITNQVRKYLLHHAQSFNILNFRYCVSSSYSRNFLWLVGKQVFERAKKGSHCWILTYVAFQTLNLATKRFWFAGKGTLYTNQKRKIRQRSCRRCLNSILMVLLVPRAVLLIERNKRDYLHENWAQIPRISSGTTNSLAAIKVDVTSNANDLLM